MRAGRALQALCGAVAAVSLAQPAGAAPWSAPQSLGFQGRGPHDLALAAAPNGTFTALWFTPREVRFATGSPRGHFSDGRRVPGSVVRAGKQLDSPKLAIGDGGRAVLAYRSDARVQAAVVRRGQASKAAYLQPATGVQVLGGVALGPRGVVAVAFRDAHVVYLSVSRPGRRFRRGVQVAAGTPVGCYFRAGRAVVVYLSGMDLLEQVRLRGGGFSPARRVGTVTSGEPTFDSAPTFTTAPDGTEAGVWLGGDLLTVGLRDAGGSLATTTLTGSRSGERAAGAVAVTSGGRALLGWTDGFQTFAVAERRPGGRLGGSTLVPSLAASSLPIAAGIAPDGWGVLAWHAATSARPDVSTGLDAMLVSPRGTLGQVTALGRSIFPVGAALGGSMAVVAWFDPRHDLRLAHARLPRR